MKLIRIGQTITKMTNEELMNGLAQAAPQGKAISYVNEISRRQNFPFFGEAFTDPSIAQYIMKDPEIVKIIINMVQKDIKDPIMCDVVDRIIEYNTDPNIWAKITSLALSDNAIGASVFINAKTPDAVVSSIFNRLALLERSRTLQNTPFLQEIINLLRSGKTWGNANSGSFMLSRVYTSGAGDSFLTEVSKYNLCPELAKTFINCAESIQTQNKSMKDNVESNKHYGFSIARFQENKTSFENILPSIANEYSEASTEEKQWIRDIILKNVSEELFNFTREDGHEILSVIIKDAPEAYNILLNKILSGEISVNRVYSTDTFAYIINNGIKSFEYKYQILENNDIKNVINVVDLTPENREIVNKYYNKRPVAPVQKKDKFKNKYLDEEEQNEEIDIWSNNVNNWYIKYAINKEMLREAGWKENIATSLVAALLMIFSGSTVEAASKKTNVDVATIVEAMKDPNMINKVKKLKEIKMTKDVADASMPTTDEIFDFISHNECYKDKSGNPILNFKAYLDPSKKNMAIGVGFNLDRPQAKSLIEKMGLNYKSVRSGKQTLTEQQVKSLFKYDSDLAISIAKKFVNNFDSLPHALKLVLIDMAYNMGENKLGQFKKFKAAIENNDYLRASKEMQNSKWFSQVGNRATRSLSMVESLQDIAKPLIAKL